MALVGLVALLFAAAAAHAEEPSAYAAEVHAAALPVPGFLPAVLLLPKEDAPRPVVVAAHGAGEDPEATCHAWFRRVHGELVVLCPRGKAMERGRSGFYYPTHFVLQDEVLAALGALRRAHPARLDGGPVLYTGYSQGATMGALFLVQHGGTFPQIVLTEGGFDWSASGVARFKATGGKRVLFVCGRPSCDERARASAKLLERAGLRARVEYVPGAGHTDVGAVGERLDATYRWALGAED
jgi:predicted esterase